MLKKICNIGCLVLVLAMMSVPAWSSDSANTDADDLVILVRGGHGPGDGTGNGSQSGDCPNLKTGVNDDFLIIAGRGNGGGNGGGKGSGGNGGNGSGGRGSGRNGGVCPWGNS